MPSPAAALSLAATKQNPTGHVTAGPRAPQPFRTDSEVASMGVAARPRERQRRVLGGRHGSGRALGIQLIQPA